MTYHIKFTNAYKKSYKRAKKRGWNLKHSSPNKISLPMPPCVIKKPLAGHV